MMGFTRGLLKAALFAGAFALAAPAQAGFQWTAPMGGAMATSAMPIAPAPRMVAPRAPAAPVTPVMSETLPNTMGDMAASAPIATTPDGPASAAPIYGNGMTNDPITWNPTHNAANTAPMVRAPQNVLPAETVPLTAAPPVMMPAMPATPAGYGMYEVAEGFGRDLPLVMAIRQIVPASYGFVFDDGIDLQARVSWQGGRPWDVVLQDTLTPLNLAAAIRGNVVSITRLNAPAPMQIAAATAGPQVVTNMVSSTTTMNMTATPVAMSAPPAPIMGAMAQGYMEARTTSADLMSTTTWTAPRGSTLRSILESWAGRAGVEVYWASEYDYPIQGAVSLQGTFEEAVQTLLKGLADSKPRPLGRLHPNLPNGPAVLVIETRQNSM